MHGISTLATGMKTSIKVYFRKKVTEQYPENRKELKMFDRFRGTLNMPHNENNEHRCVACGLCQMACPNDTIKVTSETVETEDGKKKKILKKMSTRPTVKPISPSASRLSQRSSPCRNKVDSKTVHIGQSFFVPGTFGGRPCQGAVRWV